MTAKFLIIFDPVLRTGLLGIGFVVVTVVDGILTPLCRGKRAVLLPLIHAFFRIFFLIGCLYFVLKPSVTMLRVQDSLPSPTEWPPFGYFMGCLGKADDLLHVWVDLVLFSASLWMLIQAAYYVISTGIAVRNIFGDATKEARLVCLRSFLLMVSTVAMCLTICGMRMVLHILHPG